MRLSGSKSVAQLTYDLQVIVGLNHVHTSDTQKLEASTPYREGRPTKDYLAVVDPTNTAEIAQVVKYCMQHNIGLITQGGLTSLTHASIPVTQQQEKRPQIIMRMGRLNAIHDVVRNKSGAVVAVKTQPGIPLHQVNDALKQYGVRIPIGLGIGFKAQIGGMVATNAGGTEAAFRGRPDSLVTALTVVTPDGHIWKLPSHIPGAPKISEFIGQEGITGIITDITISTYPLPKKRKVAFVETSRIEDMHVLLDALKKEAAVHLNAFERIDDNMLNLMCGYYQKPNPFAHKRAAGQQQARYNILIELESADGLADLDGMLRLALDKAQAKGAIQTAWVAENEQEADEIWSYRLVKLSEAGKRRTAEIGGNTVSFDIGLPEGDHAAFPDDALAQKLKETVPGIELYAFGHAAGLGKGGTFLHFNPIVPKGTTKEQIQAVKDIVYTDISRRGGTIAAEHGVGSYKLREFKQFTPDAYQQRIRLKKKFDRKDILNPGKVVYQEDVLKSAKSSSGIGR